MTERYKYDLALPPRHIPWLVRSQVLFGGFINQFGWIFFGFGLIFFWVFGLNADIVPFGYLSFPYFSVGGYETAAGVVLDIEETGASENDTPVYANYYSFRVESLEAEYQGLSYSTGNRFERGQTVTVEYLSHNPTLSRIEGTRRALFPLWVLCIVMLFPLIGLGFMTFGLKNGLKAHRLLAEGKIGLGVLKSKVATGASINDQPVYKLTFEFVADNGISYELHTRTHTPHLLEDESKERLLYAPSNPAYAVMLDSLPGSPDIDEMGHIQVGSLKSGLGVLILPILTLVGHSTVFLLLML